MGPHNRLDSSLLLLMKAFPSPKDPEEKITPQHLDFIGRSDNMLPSFFTVNCSLTMQKPPEFLQQIGSLNVKQNALMREQVHLDDYPFSKKGCNQGKESRIPFLNESEAEPRLNSYFSVC